MKPEVVYPDPEPVIVELLAERMAGIGEDVTCDIGVPTDWNRKDSKPHLQVDLDGTPLIEAPIRAFSTIRVVAWADRTSEAKRLAGLAHGLLLASSGHGGTDSISHLTGLDAVQDTKTKAELASITVRVGMRSVPIVPAGS